MSEDRRLREETDSLAGVDRRQPFNITVIK